MKTKHSKAIHRNKKEFVEVHLSNRTIQGRTAGSDAVRIVQALIVDNPDVLNEYDDNGWSVLHSTARFGHLQAVQEIVDGIPGMEELRAVDIDHPDINGDTPLMLAIKGNHPYIAIFLLDHGADFSKADINGMTAMHYAIHNSLIDVIAKLVEVGAPVDHFEAGIQNVTPITFSVAKNRIEVVDYLLSQQPELLTRLDARGMAPLHTAAVHGNAAMIDHLAPIFVAQSKSVDLPDSHGKTALFEAVHHHKDDALKVLIEIGANPSLAA